MGCPKCQCSEISASGMCLWCGYQVNAPAAENRSGLKESRENSGKVDPPSYERSEEPTPQPSSRTGQSPSTASTPSASSPRRASEPKESVSEPVFEMAGLISDQPGRHGIPGKAQVKPTAEGAHIHRTLFIRTLSGLIDLAAITASTGVLILAAHFFWGMHVRDPKSFVHWSVLFLVVYFLYSLLFVGLANQTIGMMLTHLVVVAGKSARSPEFSTVLARSCGYLISLLCIGIGLIWALFDPEHLCFHDRITDTRVVPLRHLNAK